ncbi:MAG: hypothetical protein FD159_2751, partial [Syntrophaceae bacterium]
GNLRFLKILRQGISLSNLQNSAGHLRRFWLFYGATNGGTRHSSVRALRRYHSPEEIKEAAMSKTNKAFERYMGQANDDDILSIYRKSAKVIPINKTGKELVTLFDGQKNAK